MNRRWTPTRPGGAAGRVLAAALLVLALGTSVFAGPGARPAHANGTPIRIVLSYLQGVSNFGPRNATGSAELITSEGEVRLTAAGLQQLPDTEEYRLWISSNIPNERLSLVPFTPDGNGVARVDVVLKDPIPEKAWQLMVVTVEAKGSAPAAPSERRSIAGRFPSQPGGGGQPAQLPNTGGTSVSGGTQPSGWLGLSNGGTLLLLALVVGGIGFALGRAGTRRGARGEAP